MARSVAVVGGGFAGVGAVVMLARAGYRDVTVFERGERIGGVWHHNTYPGASCDVPSHLYEFSFAPNPRWSRRYAPQAEIQAYVEDVARRNGVMDRIRTNTEVTGARWDEERGKWQLETSAGAHEADVLVTACGQLSVPSIPRIPGLDDFEGPAFHTAQWRHDVDLTGKRVAVIGTGCSAPDTPRSPSSSVRNRWAASGSTTAIPARHATSRRTSTSSHSRRTRAGRAATRHKPRSRRTSRMSPGDSVYSTRSVRARRS